MSIEDDKCQKIADEVGVHTYRHLLLTPKDEISDPFKQAIYRYVDAWLDREIAKDKKGVANES